MKLQSLIVFVHFPALSARYRVHRMIFDMLLQIVYIAHLPAYGAYTKRLMTAPVHDLHGFGGSYKTAGLALLTKLPIRFWFSLWSRLLCWWVLSQYRRLVFINEIMTDYIIFALKICKQLLLLHFIFLIIILINNLVLLGLLFQVFQNLVPLVFDVLEALFQICFVVDNDGSKIKRRIYVRNALVANSVR